MYINHIIITTWFGRCNFCFRKLNRKESRYGIVFDNKSAYGLELICSECLAKSKSNTPTPEGGERWVMEINPCPFCKSEDTQLITGKGKFDRVRCNSCGATGPWHCGHPEDAVSDWNAVYQQINPTPKGGEREGE